MIMVAGEQGVASLNQLEAPRGHSFGVGEQELDNYARPEGRQRGWGSWGKGQPAPSPSARGSGERCKLPSMVRAEPCRPPTGFLATRLPLTYTLFYTCKLQLCVELFMPIRLQHIFMILLYRPIFIWGHCPSYGARPAGPPCRRSCSQGHSRKLFKSRKWILDNLFLAIEFYAPAPNRRGH